MSMRVVIVEDEALVAKALQRSLAAVAPTAKVLAVLDSLAGTRAYFDQHPAPDLLFLDIQLSDGTSFDLLTTHPITCPIIFTTAYDEYALRAFKVNSIDYLLKPIDNDELARALDKFHRLHAQTTLDTVALAALLQGVQPQPGPTYKERFLVHEGGGMAPLHHTQVACFHKHELVYAYNLEGRKYVTDYNTLEELEALLDPALFFRANRQSIVQLHAVANYKSGINGKLLATLRGQPSTVFDISRERASAFKSWLGH